MGFYPPDALVHEAQRRGLTVLPPDVNASDVGCACRRARVRRPAALGAARATGCAGGAAAPPAPAPRCAPASASGSATSSASAATRSRRSSRPGGPTARSARSTTWSPARARGVRRSSASPGRAPATRWPRTEGVPPRAARRVALWRLGVAAHGAQGGGGHPARAPARAAGGARPARARALGRDGRRLRDDRRDDRPTHPVGLLRDELPRPRGGVGDRPRGRRARRPGPGRGARRGPRSARARRRASCSCCSRTRAAPSTLIVPPQVYERDRLAVRTEPLVMVEGKLERFASAGGRDQRRSPTASSPSTPPTASRPRSRTSRRSTSASWSARRRRARSRPPRPAAGRTTSAPWPRPS